MMTDPHVDAFGGIERRSTTLFSLSILPHIRGFFKFTHICGCYNVGDVHQLKMREAWSKCGSTAYSAGDVQVQTGQLPRSMHCAMTQKPFYELNLLE